MFSKCKDEKEAKTLFRRLAMRLHPDYGGENDLMALLKDSYDEALDRIKKTCNDKKEKTKPQESKHEEYAGDYQKTFEDVFLYDPKLKIIEEILEYAETHKSFNTSFIDSVAGFLVENSYVTSTQYNGLLKIYYAFHMHQRKNKSS